MMNHHLRTIDPHRLNRRILLQRRNPNTVRDMANEDISPWIDLARVWAEVRQRSGDTFIEAGLEFPRQAATVTIRYRSDISRLNRVLWNGEQYGIEDVILLGRRAGLELHCELEPVRT